MLNNILYDCRNKSIRPSFFCIYVCIFFFLIINKNLIKKSFVWKYCCETECTSVCSYSSLSFQDAISSAFDSAWQYANTFEPYRQFYQENESLDLEAIRHEEHGNTACCTVFGDSEWLLNLWGGNEVLFKKWLPYTHTGNLTICLFC